MLEDITGQRFGRLTVIKFDHKNKYHIRFFLCKCDCGNYKVVSYSNLKLGRTKSCGCLHREKLSKDITGKRFNHLVSMNLDHYDGSWLENYTEIKQIEPEYFKYQNKYKVYRCGKTLYMKNI